MHYQIILPCGKIWNFYLRENRWGEVWCADDIFTGYFAQTTVRLNCEKSPTFLQRLFKVAKRHNATLKLVV